ncbi:hypothetical protein MIND_01303100 [Mycena indigotica]|uniref:Uncharacterized protein n=1 Tax=Mycena indigotica TaxID=2126181 RepID=A0A8H6S0D8_9AGAR|nr:uncharacterized protein MIND_01303100 [Mycena indigotica]KAF7290629.1 hypothetical protein MIND_01303100 [Mycena indigotica]
MWSMGLHRGSLSSWIWKRRRSNLSSNSCLHLTLAPASTQMYDSEVVIGYGSRPWQTVHDVTTQQLLFSAVIGPHDPAQWLGGIANYRVHQTNTREFVGRPRTKPSVVIDNDEGEILVYVSWNRVTQVAWYELRTGHSEGAMENVLRTVKKSGFETVISGEGSKEYVQVVALANDRKVLGSSDIVQIKLTLEFVAQTFGG